MSSHYEERITPLLAKLSLEEKVQLLTGRDFWSTWPIESIGLRSIVVSDGPSGVRGARWDERSPSLNLPSATALSSSWDIDVARQYGQTAAGEARRKGVDAILGPTINLHRSPLGGRHFEAFSEDPLLTAELAASFVTGVQETGIGATPKHYVANDFETERFTVNVNVDERTLRELYLLAFEKSITVAHAWLVMSAYNSVNGTTATENDLLRSPLNDEWGFDGVVISDWTAVRSLASAKADQDLVMPGPTGPWGEALVAAVRSGEIEEAVVDRKVARLLVFAARVGAIEGIEPAVATPETTASEVPSPESIDFARHAAVEGAVLVRNQNALPLAPQTQRIAVIGANAKYPRTQGGGSATVIPNRVVTPLEGIKEAFPRAEISYSLGSVVEEAVAELPLEALHNPISDKAGVHTVFLDHDGHEVLSEDRFSNVLVYIGGYEDVLAKATTLKITTEYLPETTGTEYLAVSAVGQVEFTINGETLIDKNISAVGQDLGASLLAPPVEKVPIQVTEGQPVSLEITYHLGQEAIGAFSVRFGQVADNSDPQQLIQQAADTASEADVAIVVVGTNSTTESEGYDRTTLALPGTQDKLVEAVSKKNPNTIVVINSGSPVLLPWREDVSAILVSYFAGQEFGHALADILTGSEEPGGRLPTTWPAVEEDIPVLNVTPENGQLSYSEGIHIGYRAWLRSGKEPAYSFGSGEGYTSWSFDELSVGAVQQNPSLNETHFPVTVKISNTGDRNGKQVVQLYAERTDSSVDRPIRWLIGFAVARVAAGQSATVSLDIPLRTLAYWDNGWQIEAGQYTIVAGGNLTDTPLHASLTVTE